LHENIDQTLVTFHCMVSWILK